MCHSQLSFKDTVISKANDEIFSHEHPLPSFRLLFSLLTLPQPLMDGRENMMMTKRDVQSSFPFTESTLLISHRVRSVIGAKCKTRPIIRTML